MNIFQKFFYKEKPQARTQNTQEDIYTKLIQRQKFIYNVDMGVWRAAHQQAIDVYRPRRDTLMQVYSESMLDTFLSGKIQTRILNVLNTPFKIVNSEGEKVDELTNMLNKKWFYDFLREVCNSIFYGYSLVEFSFDKNGEVAETTLIPRENVIPEKNAFLTDIYSENLVPISDYQNTAILIGDRNDLGLLLKTAPHAIMKRHSKAFWSRYQELYGIPFRMAKYSGQNKKVQDDLETNLKNMGSAAYAVFPKDTELEFIETTGTDAFSVFLEGIRQCNEEMSQCVLGVTASQTDSGSFARDKVSYEKEGDISFADLRGAEFVVNDFLAPLLNNWRYNFEGLRYVFEPNTKLPLANTQLEIDTMIAQYFDIEESYILDTYGVPVTKKPLAQTSNPQGETAFGRDLENLFPAFYGRETSGTLESFTAIKFDENWAKDDYKPLIAYYADVFAKAILKGWEANENKIFSDLLLNATDFANAKYLQVFSEIKANPANAKAIFAKHERYLLVESQHFTASAQTAEKWQGFVAKKDSLPYLQWITTKDDFVRPEHKALNGIIQEVDSDFWLTHWVPFGYGCRCTIRQISKATAEKDPNFGKPLPNSSEIQADSPMFAQNAGITGKAFNDKHPYFSNKD